jgi:hypothetical protein
MSTNRHHLRPVWVALLAIAGMVSVSDMASACSAQPSKSTRSCCVKSSMAGCSCCAPRTTTRAVASETPAPAARPAPVRILTSSAESCACRLSEPAAPANGPRSHPTAEDRDKPACGELFSLVVAAARPAARADHAPSPNASPPDFPLYLRTARFLI